jgi:hypothetical protein
MKSSKLWLNEGKGSWHYVVHYCYCLVYSRLTFINTNLYNCSCDLCIFILGRVFIVYVVLYAVFRLIFVLFYVMCVICVLCLIVVALPPGENTFAVKINNNKIRITFHCPLSMTQTWRSTFYSFWKWSVWISDGAPAIPAKDFLWYSSVPSSKSAG